MVPIKEIERSVQMRLYVLQKRHFMGIFGLFFACLSVVILIRKAGPSAIQSHLYESADGQQSLSGPYKLQSEYLDKFHQRLWLTMIPTTKSQEEFHQMINVTVTLRPSSAANPQIYKRQRIIHCQNQVSGEYVSLLRIST